jgi:tetratricopeptide (TPR) repeat protein
MNSAVCRAICLGACLLVWLGLGQTSGFSLPVSQSARTQQDGPSGVSVLRNRALEEGEAGKTSEALRDYQSALALQPDWKEGWWNLGMLEYSQKQFRDAQRAFQNEAHLAPGVGIVWALLGLSEYETGAFDNAEQHLEHAQKLGIQEDEEIARVSSYHLGLLCARSGKFERAAQLLRASFGAGTMPPQVKLALGLATLRIPLLPQQLDPSREALVSEAGGAAAVRDPEQFADLLKTHPGAPNLHLAYGEALAAAGKSDGALAQFRDETAISPQSPIPWADTARILIAEHKGSEAVGAARNAVRLAEKSPDAHLLLADALESAGELAKANTERDFASTLSPIPFQPDPLVRSYYANAELGDASPKTPDQAVWNDALRAYMADDFSKSAADLKTWLAANASNGTAWALLGLCEFALHDYDNALIHLDRSARLGMNASTESLDQARYTYGVLLVRAGRFDEADSILATAWQGANPMNPKVEFALGLSLLRRGELPENVTPRDADLVREAGRISLLLQQSKYEEAFPLFKVLLERYPSMPYLHYAYGTALLAVSDFDSAAVQMKAERPISPESELPCLRLASISLRQHTPEEAIKWAQCALNLNSHSIDGHYLLGRASLDMGDATSAIRELEAASELSPASPEIHFNLAKAYARANRPEKAQIERETFTRLSQAQNTSDTKPKTP